MKYTSRADLLIAAGESIKMQEKAGIEPVCKIDKDIEKLSYVSFILDEDRYEFPLAVVEGKPVFAGDKMYNTNTGCELSVHPEWTTCWDSLSWNQPKPATVMVELPVSVAEKWANPENFSLLSVTDVQEACRKALEKA